MMEEKKEGMVLEGSPKFIDMPKDGQLLKDEDLKKVSGGGWIWQFYPKSCLRCGHTYDFSVDRFQVFSYKGLSDWPYVHVTCSRCGTTIDYLNPGL